MKPILIPVTIAGIPAKVKVTHYKVVEAIDSDASDADAEIKRQLRLCVRYLADLNGCDWIKGDDPGSVDMRQRAKSLQETAFAAMTTGGA